jgi:rhodanese-related sulfurtransferase
MRRRRRHSHPDAPGASTLDGPRAVECRFCPEKLTQHGLCLLLVVLAAAAAGTISACMERKISDRDLVLIDSTEAIELVGKRKKLLGLAGTSTGVWVDPRGERAYREGHVPGAISLPFQNVSDERRRLEGYDVLVVYGDDYEDPIAKAMSKRLMRLGFADVRMLRGGLRAWTEAGLELETGDDRR